MSQWEMVRLGEVCVLNMGQSPESSSYNDKKDGLPFFQGNADFGDKNPTTRLWCNSPKKIANDGELLLSVRAPVGAVNVATEKCCIGRGVASLSPSNNLDSQFFFHFLKSSSVKLNEKATGSTFKAINKSVLEDFLVPLPPLETQQHMAKTLDLATEIIEGYRQKLNELEKLVQSVFYEMFGDPVENEKGWEIEKFTEIATSRLGKMLDSKKNTGECSFPYLANYNVQWFEFRLNNLNEMDFTEADRMEFNLAKGDLLICEGGEVGRCAVWNEEICNCYFQKALHRVRCNPEKMNPHFLSYLFYMRAKYNSFRDIVGTQCTIAHLTGVKLKEMMILTPPIRLQEEFAQIVEKIQEEKALVQEGLREAEQLFGGLLQGYFE